MHLLNILLITLTLLGQRTKKARKSQKELLYEMDHHNPKDDDCIFTNKLNLQQRLKKYPFSKAVRIVAVSYHAPMPYDLENTGLHIKDQILDTTRVLEIKTLNPRQIARLTNIIYNTDYKRKYIVNTVMEGGCFEPRNALIFYDKKGKVFDYIEMCFQCLHARSASDKITIGTACSQKYDLLKSFFKSIGITITNIH